MAEIHVFPVQTIDRTHLDRLCRELSSAHQGNVDLGSRQAHIRQIAETLQHLSQVLQGAIDHPGFPVEALDAEFNRITADMRLLAEKTEAGGARAPFAETDLKEGLRHELTRVRATGRQSRHRLGRAPGDVLPSGLE